MGNLLSWLTRQRQSNSVQMLAQRQWKEKQEEYDQEKSSATFTKSSNKQSKENSASTHKMKKPPKNKVEARLKRKKTNVEHLRNKSNKVCTEDKSVLLDVANNDLLDERSKPESPLTHMEPKVHETTHEENWCYTPPPDNQRTFYFTEDKLEFTSQFDSGNMIVVERVAALTYNVYNAFDCGNSPKQTNNRQWFHFAVRGLRRGDVLTITIVGVTHSNMFTYDWTPVIAYEANALKVSQEEEPTQQEYEKLYFEALNVEDTDNSPSNNNYCSISRCCKHENINKVDNVCKSCHTTINVKVPLEYKRLTGESIVTTHTHLPPTPGYPSFVYHECDKSKQHTQHNIEQNVNNNFTSSADVIAEISSNQNNNDINCSDDEAMHSAVSLANEEENINDNNCCIGHNTKVDFIDFSANDSEIDDTNKTSQQSANCVNMKTGDEEKSTETEESIHKMQPCEIEETQEKNEAEVTLKEDNIQRSCHELENAEDKELHLKQTETSDVDPLINKTESKSEAAPEKIKKNNKKKDIAMSLTFSVHVEHDVPLCFEQTESRSEYSALYIASNHPYSYTTLQNNIVRWRKLAEECKLVKPQQEIIEEEKEIEKESSELEHKSENDNSNANTTIEVGIGKADETLMQNETMESTEDALIFTKATNTQKTYMCNKNQNTANSNENDKIYFHHEVLCTSLDGLNVDLLSISDMSKISNERMPPICTSPVIIPFNSSSLSHHTWHSSAAFTIDNNENSDENKKVDRCVQSRDQETNNVESHKECIEEKCEEQHIAEKVELLANSTEQSLSRESDNSNKGHEHNTTRPFQFDASKKVVVLSARVHPGECAGSHVMHGCIEFLLNAHDKRAAALREEFVFMLIPMLNPDGVRRGHSRVDGNGVDLNRMYRNPSHKQHPSVFALKSLLLQLIREDRLALYIDLHAHANKRGTFLYGNSMPMTQLAESVLFAKLISLNTSYFDFKCCNFSESNMFAVGKSGRSKDGSCRVMLFLETGFSHAYVIEASHVAGNTFKAANSASRTATNAVTTADVTDKANNNNNSEKSTMTKENERESATETTKTHLTNESHLSRSAKALNTNYFSNSTEDVYSKSERDRDVCSFRCNNDIENNKEEYEEESSETSKRNNAMCEVKTQNVRERSKSTSALLTSLKEEEQQQQQQRHEIDQDNTEDETNTKQSFCDYLAKSNVDDANTALVSAINDTKDGRCDIVNSSNYNEENTNQYSPQTFAETGKAILVALLDINNCNPQSRLSRTLYHSLSGLKLWLHRQMQLSLAENVFMHLYKERDAIGKKKCQVRNNSETVKISDNAKEEGNINNWEEKTCSPSHIISTVMTLPRYEHALNKMTIRNSRLLPSITYNDVHNFLPARVAISLLTQTPSNAVLRTLAAECASRQTQPKEQLTNKRFTFINVNKADNEGKERVSYSNNFNVNKVCRSKTKNNIPFSLHYKNNTCNILADTSDIINGEKDTELDAANNVDANDDDDEDDVNGSNDDANNDVNNDDSSSSNKENVNESKYVNIINADYSDVNIEDTEVVPAPVIAQRKKRKVNTIENREYGKERNQ